MSVKKHKLDLLFKVRFQNPLPPPPCPPKLLHIPTNSARYARPEFTASLTSSTPLPMVVDAEMGMPLDLCQWECLWNDEMDDKELNPDPKKAPPVDPKDAFMLGGDMPFASHSNGSHTPSTPSVSWLRKTEYISREHVNRSSANHDLNRAVLEQKVDVSRDAQIKDIEGSFENASGSKFDLSKLRHPSKPGVTAVDSYEVLPDVDIWANAYDLFRFSERPGERQSDVPDTRLDCSLLRPMESDGDHFLAYYLPKEDETAETFKQQRRDGEQVDETVFNFVRDYETMKIEQDVPNEVIFVLDDGEDSSDPFSSSAKPAKAKGAYYKGLERKITLKKRRVNQWDAQYTDKWDAINLTLVPFSTEEDAERDELLAEVTDPNYMYNRQADADAEGEVDDSIPPPVSASSLPNGGGAGVFDEDVNVEDGRADVKVDVKVDVTG